MRVSVLIALGSAIAAGAVVTAVYGLHGGWETALLMAVVGAAGLAIAHLAAARRRRLALRGQFAAGVAITVGLVLLATVLGAVLMFVSDRDAVMIAVITVFAGALAARAAILVASGVLADVHRIGDGLAAVAEGRRDVLLGIDGRDELTGLAAEADAMVGRLAAEEKRASTAETARRNLVAAASHDLRTPLSALRLMVQAFDDELVDERTRRRYQRTMRTHVKALSALVDDLFELSRIEAGDVNWSLSQVLVGELVDETVQALEPEAESRGIALDAQLDQTGVSARADPEKLQRVLFNLVHNAIRHTPADGSVTIRASSAEDCAEIEVADTGAGVSAADRAHVFEPFYRGGEDAARQGDGAGLGLAISKAIVEAHGGRIWIESSLAGTRVKFTLPTAA